jgi:hypothetical protein
MYEYYLLGDNPHRSLYDELVEIFKSKDPNSILVDFKKFVTHYKKDVYNREDALMYSFWYLRWTMYWKSIVLTALHTGYSDYDKFLQVFRRYYYLNWIAGNTMTKIKQTSFNIIKWLKENVPVSAIEAELEKIMSDTNNQTISRATDNLNYEIYWEPWCKPLLFMIEYNQQDNPPYFPIGDKSIHVEHILPRSYKRSDDWASMHNDSEFIDEWLNCGANLTLLSGTKNIAASNNNFESKLKSYDGTGYHTSSDSKVTSFTITQKIVNDYRANKFNGEWNIEALEARWRWFCEEASKVLEIDLSELKNQTIKPTLIEEPNN